MNRDEVEKQYKRQGLIVEFVSDASGKVYEPHRHEQTYLYTLRGSVKIKVGERPWQSLKPGTEFIVGTNQLHEARVGHSGWDYVAAWDPVAAKKFKHS